MFRRSRALVPVALSIVCGAGFMIPASAYAASTAAAPDVAITSPAITAAVGAPSIMIGQAVALTLTISNANPGFAFTGVAVFATLPSGLTVSDGTASGCGGTVTRTSPSGIALAGGSVAANSSCQFSVMVTGTAAGTHVVTTGAVTATEVAAGNTATASINVDGVATIGLAFSPASIAVGGTTNLTFTITDPAGNPDTLRFIGLSDTLPAGLTVASAAAVTTCVGTLTVTAPNSIVLTAATAAVGTPCQFSVPVVAAAAGSYTNTVTSSQGGFDFANTATASVGVAAAAPTPTPTPAPTTTPPPTTTSGSGNGDGNGPAPALFVLMAISGLAAAGLTMRRRSATRS